MATPVISPEPAAIASRIADTYHRIQQHIRKTRLIADDTYHLRMKCENEQETGSFKWRGALSKLSLMSPGSRLVTASTGNHGLAVATAARLYGLDTKIFIPQKASLKKVEKLKAVGADLQMVDGDSLDAELAGKAYALENNLTWVSPYNDEDVIAGQGTIAAELTGDGEPIHRVYVTVGGGGLMSGIASWLSIHVPDVEIIGCQPLFSPEMFLSTQAGYVVTAPESLPTLSDGSAGPLEEDSITFDLCNRLIDRFVLIPEEDIKEAIRYANEKHGLIIEGAAGVALAAAMHEPNPDWSQRSIVVLCGGNIDPIVHQKIVEGS